MSGIGAEEVRRISEKLNHPLLNRIQGEDSYFFRVVEKGWYNKICVSSNYFLYEEPREFYIVDGVDGYNDGGGYYYVYLIDALSGERLTYGSWYFFNWLDGHFNGDYNLDGCFGFSNFTYKYENKDYEAKYLSRNRDSVYAWMEGVEIGVNKVLLQQRKDAREVYNNKTKELENLKITKDRIA
jgi:hypothetical protein